MIELITDKIETNNLKLFGTSHALAKLNEDLALSFTMDTHMILSDKGISFEEAKLKYHLIINFKPIIDRKKEEGIIKYKTKDDNELEVTYVNPLNIDAVTEPIVIFDDKENGVYIYMQICITPVINKKFGEYFKVEFYFYEK